MMHGVSVTTYLISAEKMKAKKKMARMIQKNIFVWWRGNQMYTFE